MKNDLIFQAKLEIVRPLLNLSKFGEFYSNYSWFPFLIYNFIMGHRIYYVEWLNIWKKSLARFTRLKLGTELNIAYIIRNKFGICSLSSIWGVPGLIIQFF